MFSEPDGLRVPEGADGHSVMRCGCRDSRNLHDLGWWSWPGLNRRPRECHSRALPTALQPHIVDLEIGENPCETTSMLTWPSRHSQENGSGSSQIILLARRTRTIKLCSLGRRARLGALGVGRVRMSRAVKDNLAAPLKGDEQAWKEHVYRPMCGVRDRWGFPSTLLDKL